MGAGSPYWEEELGTTADVQAPSSWRRPPGRRRPARPLRTQGRRHSARNLASDPEHRAEMLERAEARTTKTGPARCHATTDAAGRH